MMGANRGGLPLAAAVAVALGLAACAAPVTPGTNARPTAGTSNRADVARAGRVPEVKVVDLNVTTTLPQEQVSADASNVNLEFSFADTQAPAAYRLANTPAVADCPATPCAPGTKLIDIVAKVEFKLTGANLAAPLTATVTRAQFLNGKAVIQFNHLPPGPLTVSAIAYNSAGAKVVEANGTGTVQPGKLTQLKLVCVVPPGTPVETGHIRIEMDCFNTDCFGDEPKPQPSSFVPNPVEDVTFSSLGDPHEDGANGYKFDNNLPGTFMAIRTLTDDFMLVKNHGADVTGKWPGATINNAVAIRSGEDTFLFYLYGSRARLNGRPVALLPDQSATAPGGLSIKRMAGPGPVLMITSPQGDKLRIDGLGHYLNLTGSIGKDRVVHEVRGSLGTFNNGTPLQGRLLRDGTAAPDLKSFLENWVANWRENLFAGGEAIIPANPKPEQLPANKATN